MRYLLSAREMKEWDGNTINQYHMPAMVLMERAALEVIETMKAKKLDLSEVLVFCGTGNNGGDGIAIARLLFLEGSNVTIYLPGDKSRLTTETKEQIAIAESYGIKTDTTLQEKPYTVIVDALFGIGLTRKISGAYKEALLAVGALAWGKDRRKAIPVVAVDMPSGIHSDTGAVMGAALKADLTVTFGGQKLGQLLYPGAEYCGKCVVADIGITEESLPRIPSGYTYEEKDLKRLPKRAPRGNKGTFGKVLVIAGSRDMGGAAYLSAMSAFRMGAGMVRIYTDRANREMLLTMLPEAILTTYEQEKFEELSVCMDWADVVIFGPGIGTNTCSKKLFFETLLHLSKKQLPCVMDADALNLFSEMEFSGSENLQMDFPVVMTPHLGEMSRLTGKKVEEIKDSLIETAVRYAKEKKVVLVLKDARTVVSWGEDCFYLNSSGNSGMATAGSGDVLAGCIGALIGQGLDFSEAARLGVFIHGLGGDLAAKEKGKAAMMAGDIICGMESVRKTYEEI